MATMHEVAPDALPYFDQGYEEPGVREMVGIEQLSICDSFRFLD